MPKCSDCGFLAVWLPTQGEFVEASETFRHSAYFPQGDHKGVPYQVRCFVRAQDLAQEVQRRIKMEGDALAPLRTIDADRVCQSCTPWLQGFSPKEHQELRFQEEVRNQQRKHENLTLLVAMIGAGISAVSIIVGAFINLDAAKIEATATSDSARQQTEAIDRQTTIQIQAQQELTQMQIDAQKALTSPVPALIRPGAKAASPMKSEPHP